MSPLPAPGVKRVTTTGAGLQDGSSWANACNGIDGGLALASSGDELWVKQGTYQPSNMNTGFVVSVHVSIYGAFLGTETSVATRGGLATATILEGGTGGTQAPHVVAISGVGSPGVLIDSVQIQDGNASSNRSGGGITCTATDLDMKNCVLKSNYADMNGGGLYFVGTGGSSGIANTLHLVGCEFNGNWTTFADGGAVYGSWVKGDAVNCNFLGNHVGNNGGAMYLWNMGAANPFGVTDCVFWNNAAYGGSSLGGAVYLGGSSLSSSYGAAATFVNCTMADNLIGSCSDGQAIYLTTNAVTNSRVYNCILALNNAGGCGTSNPIGEAAAATVEYTDCFVTAGVNVLHAGTGNLWADPKFRNHALAGGLTLLAGSDCIDAADYGRVPADIYDIDGNGNTGEKLPFDFLYQRRLVDRVEVDKGHSDSTPGHTYLDMGAYEKP